MSAPHPDRTSGLTARIAALVTARGTSLSDESCSVAERALVDTVAVITAATGEPSVRIALTTLAGDGGAGPSTVFALGSSTTSPQAALLNGLSAHALDYDDVDDAFIGHPSAVLVPALLSVGEARDVSGQVLIEAYWVGLRTCRLIASSLGIVSHYEAGWHSTGTVGSIGAAAAVARLLDLDESRTRHVLGIAGSLAAGSRQNFGTMTKPLHAGTAAECGVRAALLAEAGFTADVDQLEGPLGFVALHSGGSSPRATAAQGEELARVNVKLYPCCYYTHSAADAALELAPTLRADEVREVVVTVQKGGMAPLIHHRPRTGLEGKFSMEYVVAAALLDGQVSFGSFDTEQVLRPEAQALLRRVQAVEADGPPVGDPSSDGVFTLVTVTTADGQPVTSRVDRAHGHATRPPTDEQLRHKLEDCLASTGRLAGADGVFDLLRGFRTVGSVRTAVRELSALLGNGSEVVA